MTDATGGRWKISTVVRTILNLTPEAYHAGNGDNQIKRNRDHTRIIHTASPDGNVELSPGDTIVVPVGFVHNARNAGDGAAVLFITFSSANRQFIVVPE